jgi:hypothetical protein
MHRIANYFNLLSDKLDIERQTAGLTVNNSDIGTNRERILSIFLSKHLPRRLFATLGGMVFGSQGDESRQIDVLVASDLAINFQEHEKMFVSVESIAAAISVKSFLNGDEVAECLSNLASIPQCDPDVLKFKMLKPNTFDVFCQRHPALFIFAYDGLTADTIAKHVLSYLKGHSSHPGNRLPIEIIVNRKYSIRFTGSDSDPLRIIYYNYSNRGFPLAQIVNRIGDYADWLSFVTLHNNIYIQKSFDLIGD